jgi:hypothetical protein
MRPSSIAAPTLPDVPKAERQSDLATLKKLMPYFWEYRVRMAIALCS